VLLEREGVKAGAGLGTSAGAVVGAAR
jgi:hypothetical protein